MAASKPPPLSPISPAFVRIVAWILLCACTALILLKLLFLIVVIIVGSLLLSGHAVNKRGVPAILRGMFRCCLFSKGSCSLSVSQPHTTTSRDAVRENPSLRKLFIRPDIVSPPPPRGTGCGAKSDVFRATDNEVNNASHRRTKEIRHLEEKFRAADAESVERVAASKPFLDQRMVEFEAKKAQGFLVPGAGETTTTRAAQAATLRDRLRLDDYEDINDLSETLGDQVTTSRLQFEQSYMVMTIRGLKKAVEERDKTILEPAKKFVAFKDGVRDVIKRWEKTLDTLGEKLKTRDVEIDDLRKRVMSVKNEETDREPLEGKARRREYLCSRVDACPCRAHQSFEESDLFQEAAQRRFRRDHRATLARRLATPSPSGSSSSVNTSGAEEAVKPVRAGKRRILRPAPN